MVTLVFDHSGWVLSKKKIRSLISEGHEFYSEKQQEHMLNAYNLKSSNSFTSIDDFLEKIGQNC